MDVVDCIVEAVAERGWSCTTGFLEPGLIARLREESTRLALEGGFRAAAVGGGELRRTRADVRADEILWWQERGVSDAQRECLVHFERLRLALNRALQLGLWEFECHYARYRPGAFYRRHLDQLLGDGHRRVSCVLYLNENWKVTDEGALRLYLDKSQGADFEDIGPKGGKLVTFLSGRFPHEVLPARRERLSLTGWFRIR